MTKEEISSLKVGDTIGNNLTWTVDKWKITEIVKRGVVVVTSGHKQLVEWEQLENGEDVIRYDKTVRHDTWEKI